MYTWKYVVDSTLAKLDLTNEEASDMGLISKFSYYANEAMTQICSSIKPNRTFATFEITEDNIKELQVMPDDFISFNDDVCTVEWYDKYRVRVIEECHDDDFTYVGYNKLKFHKIGTYDISYNARWYTFDSDKLSLSIQGLEAESNLPIPDDIVDCLPSYIASQCYKVDDEVKSSIFRNEYELFLARIDNTDYKSTSTIKVGGNW